MSHYAQGLPLSFIAEVGLFKISNELSDATGVEYYAIAKHMT